MSIALTILIVVLLIGVSALCSGLNVALMALDLPDLKRKAKLGDRAAKRVLPLRRKTHLSLSAILLTNVAAVSATSLVLESVLYGLLAGIVATLTTVIFGEIFPQALFLRNSLRYVSRLSLAIRIMIFVTYPVAKPLQLLLDKLFRTQTAALQSRHELGLLISEHLGANESELDEDEVEIMRGALTLSEKRVRDIMTPIRNVYSLLPHSVIDNTKIDEIKASGLSRIPIFNREKTICFGIILVKEMVDIDFDENPPRVDELPLHPVQTVGSMTALDTMFRKFIGAHTHLVPIEKDDKIIGIVTIEDLIEEIVGQEIEDETDGQRLPHS
ncbi:MAG TPA: CNNM domain-containing protein [Candidatus Saccharimonadales bacterium]|nr:CNNM domain-containing protein [Candidatus Saccharimonadales bacterium]